MSLEDARDIVERWRTDYNEFRPHSATFIPDTGRICPKNGLGSRLNFVFFSLRLDYDLGNTSGAWFSAVLMNILHVSNVVFTFS